MSTTKYTENHEYVQIDGEVATVGITDFAQSQLGDVVFVELPEVGASFVQGEDAAVVESVKAASEIYAPVSGEIIAVNSDLEAEPTGVNADPMGKGWFMKIKLSNPSELEELMDEDAYKALVAEQS